MKLNALAISQMSPFLKLIIILSFLFILPLGGKQSLELHLLKVTGRWLVTGISGLDTVMD